jgi:type IV pilus assembly protein PilB
LECAGKLNTRPINGEAKLYGTAPRTKTDAIPAESSAAARSSVSRLGEILITENLVTREQLNEALVYQKAHGGRLGSCLVRLNFVSEEALTSVLSRQYGIASINLTYFEPDPEIIKILPRDVAYKYQAIPLGREGTTLQVALSDPNNVLVLDELKFLTAMTIEPMVASESQLREAIDRFYGTSHDEEVKKVFQNLGAGGDSNVEVMSDEEENIDVQSLERESEEAPIVRLVNLILMDSVKRGASDIHIEPYERELRVRFRVDGVLQSVMNPPLKLREALTSRIKIMSRLDISEKRLPQDGRIKMRMKADGKNKELDFRVSCLPTLFGEKVVLRLLDKENLRFDMRKLGFEQESLRHFENAISKPFGMVLVTGPTGSGKTNTLYSAISQLNKPDTNIMTAEDPVEFNLPGINQVNMKEQIGLNFAAALRSFLRQDPNIILLGEIRDFETAEIAIKAALTGHLVLSTLHTNDAPSTVSRLMNMGVEPFLVATSVNLICAQRLVRRICKECIQPIKMPAQALVDIGFTAEEAETISINKGAGCQTCSGSGYKGRVGLYEVMDMTDDLRDAVILGSTAIELKKRALEGGMISLRRSGLIKVKDGITTIEEVLRETIK